jgi:hypothetical protein
VRVSMIEDTAKHTSTRELGGFDEGVEVNYELEHGLEMSSFFSLALCVTRKILEYS